MKILHLYPHPDEMMARYVTILADGMRHSAEVRVASSANEAKVALHEMQPDIVHCHGCWQHFIVAAARVAQRNGARLVITPHGMLQPWVLEEKSAAEKISQSLLWQRRSVNSAYTLIAQGKMERQYLEQLRWNPRIETIRNPIVTRSITAEEMCLQTFAVYQKITDSYTLEHMDDDTRRLLTQLIKAGITGNAQWADLTSLPFSFRQLPDEGTVREPDWRRMLIYAAHENILNYVDYGISLLQLQTPPIETEHISAYLPPSYTLPRPLKEVVGPYEGDETAYLVKIFQQLHRQPLLLHLVELSRELRRDTVNDDLLQNALEEHHLLPFAQSLMPVLQQLTGLDEGFMPVTPVQGRLTRRLLQQIATHLKID
ncbi:MAG: glycosyltransferase [Prevotella sp.]|nr:glycosyltransferase [Prevotella sp.]